jgi:hypothetical protein
VFVCCKCIWSCSVLCVTTTVDRSPSNIWHLLFLPASGPTLDFSGHMVRWKSMTAYFIEHCSLVKFCVIARKPSWFRLIERQISWVNVTFTETDPHSADVCSWLLYSALSYTLFAVIIVIIT